MKLNIAQVKTDYSTILLEIDSEEYRKILLAKGYVFFTEVTEVELKELTETEKVIQEIQAIDISMANAKKVFLEKIEELNTRKKDLLALPAAT